MGKWLDLAAKLEGEAGGGDNRDDRDNSPQISPNVPIVPNVPGYLPEDVQRGLARLPRLPAPRLETPEVWPRIIADAARLHTDGWAEKALALGWESPHLWGAHLHQPGLAVWLEARRIVALDAMSCAVSDGPGAWSLFHRRPIADGTVFLWDYGRTDCREGKQRG